MKQLLITLVFCIMLKSTTYAQGIQQFKGKTYIFDAYEQAIECDILGTPAGTLTLMLKGSLFTVVRVPDATHLVIKFLKWKSDQSKISKYNYKVAAADSNTIEIFFLLDKSVFDASCSEYEFEQKWDINFGALTTPFKFRLSPFQFTPNLNLGTSVSYQRKFSKNWAWSIVGGISLASVSLDSFSTKGIIINATERPAVTPSVHGMLCYKTINLTLGIGWDFINRPSEIEKNWIYHRKTWIGIGIGVSLFNSNNTAQSTKAEKGQK